MRPRIPSLAFLPKGQISSQSFQNSLRGFKSTRKPESNVSSGKGNGNSTPERVEFHHIKPEYATRSLTKTLTSGQITEDDRTLIVNHVAWVEVTSNISAGRVNKLTFHLVKLRRFLGPYRTNTIDDVYAGISRLKNARVKGYFYSCRIKKGIDLSEGRT